MPLGPITDATPGIDKDGDGILVASGKIAKWGPKGSRWFHQGDGVWWPEGYVPPVEQPPVDDWPQRPNITSDLIVAKILSGWGDGELSNVHAAGLDKAIQVTKPIRNLRLVDHLIDDCKEWLYQSLRAATLADFLIDRVDLSVLHRGALVRGDSFGSIDNFVATFVASPPTSRGDFPVGLQIGSKAQADDTQVFSARVALGDLEFRDFRTNYGAKYLAQGGGLTVEGNNDVTFRRLRAFNCDEPFDIKPKVHIPYVESHDCSRSLKLWADAIVDRFVSVNPSKMGRPSSGPTCDLVCQGTTQKWLDEHPDATIPVYRFESMELAGDTARKHITGRAGALFDFVGEGNIPADKLVVEYVGKGANITYNGVQLRRRTA